MKGARTHANSTLIDLELAKEVSVNGTKVERVPLVKRISIKMTAPLFVDCYNRMPCCDSWAKNGGCQREPEFMSQYCQASCNTCTPSYNTTDACMDRHVNCVAWKADKMCSGKSADFMSENCRSSCGKCSLTRESQCFNNGKVSIVTLPPHIIKINFRSS